MTSVIAIGTANPSYTRTQTETADLIVKALDLTPIEEKILRSVYRSTGINKRYSVLSDYCKSPGEFEFFPNHPQAPFPTTAKRMEIYKKNALHLALQAIENCLEGIKPFNKSDITHLITVSCTGMYAPGIDIELMQTLNLNSTVKRTAINFMGCYGAFNALKVADAICQADDAANVLIVCVELCTIHFQDSMVLDNVIANAIFSDGAAAVIVKKNPDTEKYLNIKAFHCDLMPQTREQMAWHIGDQGFDIALSSYVPEAIKIGIYFFFNQLLNQHNLSMNAIDLFAIHPGGMKILEACEEALNIDKAQNKYAYQVLKNYGNMSSPTILFVLKEIWNEMDESFHDKKVFSCAFGPGLTLESMLLQIHA